MVTYWNMNYNTLACGWPVKTCSGDFQSNAALARWFIKRQTYNIARSQVLAGAPEKFITLSVEALMIAYWF
jgi:hypothetical protein